MLTCLDLTWEVLAVVWCSFQERTRPDSVRLMSQLGTGPSLSRISCSPIKRNAPGLAIGNAYMFTAYSKSASRMALTGTNTRGTSSIIQMSAYHPNRTEWNEISGPIFDSFTILLLLPPRVFLHGYNLIEAY